MEDTDADLVYNMTKAMVELFPEYEGKAPGINGWALDKQDFAWVVPYHEGAIRYFEEKGVWSDEAQAHNDQPDRKAEGAAGRVGRAEGRKPRQLGRGLGREAPPGARGGRLPGRLLRRPR